MERNHKDQYSRKQGDTVRATRLGSVAIASPYDGNAPPRNGADKQTVPAADIEASSSSIKNIDCLIDDIINTSSLEDLSDVIGQARLYGIVRVAAAGGVNPESSNLARQLLRQELYPYVAQVLSAAKF